MPNITWNSLGAFPGFVEYFLQSEEVISESDGITDFDRLIDFGIFSFFLWFLPHKREFYFDSKRNKVHGSYFDFYVTGIDEKYKVIFLLSTENDRFSYPKRSIVLRDPLNYLLNGDRDHSKCPVNHLISYNSFYLEHIGIDISLPGLPSGCKEHKDQIREMAIDNNIFPAVFGGWPISLNVNPEILSGFEVEEKTNREALFNEFLSIYFKYKINASNSHSNVELELPFKSHEIDVVLTKEDTIVMFETSAEYNVEDQNIKKKIYNLWSIEKIFDSGVSFYLTFGKKENIGDHLDSFLEYYEGSSNKSPHFEILTFPVFFSEIENSLKQIKNSEELISIQEEIFTQFKNFLEELEQSILNFLE